MTENCLASACLVLLLGLFLVFLLCFVLFVRLYNDWKRHIVDPGRQDAWSIKAWTLCLTESQRTLAPSEGLITLLVLSTVMHLVYPPTLTHWRLLEVSSIEREIKLFDEEGLAQSCDTVSHKLGQHPTLVRCWAFHCRRTITGLYWGTCRIMKREKYLWTVCRRYPFLI